MSQQGGLSDINFREAFLKMQAHKCFKSIKNENVSPTEAVAEYITGCFLSEHLAEHILGEDG